MGDLPGLEEVFNGEDEHCCGESGCGGLEGGETAEATGLEFPFQGRQGRTVDYGGEGLGEAVDRCEGDGGLGDGGMAEEAGEEGGWKQGQVDGEEG